MLTQDEDYVQFDEEVEVPNIWMLARISQNDTLAVAAIELVIGICLSVSYLCVTTPAGIDGSSRAEHMVTRVVHALFISPSAFVFALFDDRLDTWQWLLYYVGVVFAVFVGLRTLVEVGTGESRDLALSYVLFTLFVYVFALPIPQALHMVAGHHNWPYPWRWTRRTSSHAFNVNEIIFFVLALTGSFGFIGYATADVYLFVGRDALITSTFWRNALRPIFGNFVQSMCRAITYRGLASTRSDAARREGLLCVSFIFSCVSIRLVTSSPDGTSLAFVFLFDWLTWCYKSLMYYLLTSEWYGQQRERKGLERLLHFTVVVHSTIRDTLSRDRPNVRQYLGFEYLLQNLALSVSYVSVCMGYGWQRAIGLGPGDAAFDYWCATNSHGCGVSMRALAPSRHPTRALHT